MEPPDDLFSSYYRGLQYFLFDLEKIISTLDHAFVAAAYFGLFLVSYSIIILYDNIDESQSSRLFQ